MAITVTINQQSATENSLSVSGSYSSGGTQAHYYRFFKNGSGDSAFTSITGTTSTTKYHTYSGLSSGTSYSLTVHFYDINKQSLGSDTINMTTLSPDTTAPTVSFTSPSDYSYHSGSVTMYASASDSDSGVDYVNFYNSSLGSQSDYSSPYSATYNISSLSDGQYTFTAKAYDNAGNGSSNAYLYINVDNTDPNLGSVQGEATGTSVKVTWSASDSGSGLSYFRVYKGSSYVTKNDPTAREHTFTGLTEGTQYSFKVIAYDNAGNSTTSTTIYVTTSTIQWEWYTAKVSGNDFSLTAAEWNDFTSTINQVQTNKGYLTTNFTTAYTGNDFTAAIFNEAKNAIGGMNATGISDKVAGDSVLASDLNTLRDKLNGV